MTCFFGTVDDDFMNERRDLAHGRDSAVRAASAGEGRAAQTILGRYWGGECRPVSAAPHQVMLPDGDRLLVLETIPCGWELAAPGRGSGAWAGGLCKRTTSFASASDCCVWASGWFG